MVAINNFLIALIMSFTGSVPPGTINLTVVQMGLDNKMRQALRFSLAASAMEYPYGWIAIKFENMITSSDAISKNLSLFAALVLIVLGLINVVPKRRDGLALGKLKNSGWRRGILMGILNPLAIPYWVGITAYLRSQGWINLSTSTGLHLYLCGIVVGAFLLLALLAYLSKKVMQSFQQYPWIQKIPGYLLLVLGLYSLIVYLS